jgi:hypothetical protein
MAWIPWLFRLFTGNAMSDSTALPDSYQVTVFERGSAIGTADGIELDPLDAHDLIIAFFFCRFRRKKAIDEPPDPIQEFHSNGPRW